MHTMSRDHGKSTASIGYEVAMPQVHDAANAASLSGQRTYIKLSATRFIALFVAAVAGAAGIAIGRFDLSGLVLLLAFTIAALVEFALVRSQPERNWYAGRAIAESMKTLAWRFAVQGEPFGPSLNTVDALRLLRSRVREVLERGKDKIHIGPGDAVVTQSMLTLRNEPLKIRRAAYLAHRTEHQRGWYSKNARKNEVRATAWRYGLLTLELLAVVAAAMAFGRGTPVNFAGIVAAAVGGGAAWLAIKQHSQLTSAYRIAAGELALQADTLAAVARDEWPQAVSDAEEAISREHTMWLATKGEVD
jgi:hypothetical protein